MFALLATALFPQVCAFIELPFRNNYNVTVAIGTVRCKCNYLFSLVSCISFPSGFETILNFPSPNTGSVCLYTADCVTLTYQNR